MDEEQWPEPFDALRRQLRSEGEFFRVFETWTKETASGRCTRLLCTGLLDTREAEALPADAEFGFDVQGNAPESPADGDDDSTPEFRIWSSNQKHHGIEPLIISWESAGRRTSIPDSGFLLTYKLSPRLIVGGQTLEWDNPGLPELGVARGLSSGNSDGLIESESFWEIKRTYIQDYSTLRGKSILVSFYELWRLPENHQLARQLQSRQSIEIPLRHSSLRYNLIPTRFGDGTLFVELRGFKILALPGPAPVSVEDYGELQWPGVVESIHKLDLECNAPMLTFVCVRDQVLERFQGRPEYSIIPESGSVALGGEWAVSHCDRYGRDLIRLEIRKLYEGVPAWVVRHFHSYRIALPEGEPQELLEATNIAKRAKRVCDAYLNLGKSIHALLQRAGCTELSPRDITRVLREELDYSGWWSDHEFNRIAFPCQLEMNEDTFISRAKDLYRSTFERLQPKCMRRLLKELRFPRRVWSESGSIRCLEQAVVLSRSASEQELRIPSDARRARLGTQNFAELARPLIPLFALNSLRQLDSHHHDLAGRSSKLADALGAIGVDRNSVSVGYGVACDALYDRVAEAMEYAVDSLNL